MFKKFIIIFLLILVSTFIVTNLVWAQVNTGSTKTKVENTGSTKTKVDNHGSEKKRAELTNPIGAEKSDFSIVIGQIIKAFLGIIGTISLVMFIYGGLMMLTAAGKEAQIQKGQQTLVWASLGILLVFVSYTVLKFVFSAFGL